MHAMPPTSLDAALRRPLWLALGGVLLLVVEWLISPWGVGSLPLALVALAAGAALLLRPLNAAMRLEPEEEGNGMSADLQSVSQASLLTLAVLQLAA
ncbi:MULTISPECIES: hypothetical protein [Halomonas]|uniref:Uncharacterized protein n=1 Tax=Halomonas halophila TaxID=29573 RepID=A0ABQ0U4N3_9GAMM|nr:MULTISPECIES: hypothetical protein [Halomonas]MDR5888970.1 hypothetical protein [Halomonas salina]RAH36360.1 hypothetical protein C9J49_016505 [Halomonas sp. SL1]WJY07467.1 hypothetical protein QWG60_00780 [Halomonas halophila]GEK73398.1 hypothetical protein HHA04nite_19420 [Halomonas halophila]